MRETFDVFVHGCDLLEVLVLWGGGVRDTNLVVSETQLVVGGAYLTVAEDREVDDDAVDGIVCVRSENVFLEVVFGDFAELELEATGGGGSQPGSLRDQVFRGEKILLFARLLRPVCIHSGCGVAVCQKSHQQRWSVHFLQARLHLFQQACCDGRSGDHFAGRWGRVVEVIGSGGGDFVTHARGGWWREEKRRGGERRAELVFYMEGQSFAWWGGCAWRAQDGGGACSYKHGGRGKRGVSEGNCGAVRTLRLVREGAVRGGGTGGRHGVWGTRHPTLTQQRYE